MNNIFALFHIIKSNDSIECIPPMLGTVINHYVIKNCTACTRLNPIIEELISKLEKTDLGIKYRKVVCNNCDCDNIKTFPTIEITEDKKQIGKSTGYKKYNDIAHWVAGTLNIEKSLLLDNIIDFKESKVTQLTNNDFLTGFDGEWLVLFYENKNDPLRKIFIEIAKNYSNLKVGEIHKNEIKNIEQKIGITKYPHITGINVGLFVPFMGSIDDKNFNFKLEQFINKLIEPSFKNITYEELKFKSKNYKIGEPIYIVLYKDYDTASYYFNTLAQQFKFKANIFRSNDEKMFKMAGFIPEENNEDHNKMVKLIVYKSGSFYANPYSLKENSEIIQWIFHTHFPHVVNVNNENFYSIFHGIKPVILFVTSREQLLKEYNQIATDRHLGTPYTNVVYATLDVDEYPLFKNTVIKDVKAPGIVIFNPLESQWYYKEASITSSNFKKILLNIVENYFNKNLPVYPPRKTYKKFYIGGLIIFSILMIIIKQLYRYKSKKLEYY